MLWDLIFRDQLIFSAESLTLDLTFVHFVAQERSSDEKTYV